MEGVGIYGWDPGNSKWVPIRAVGGSLLSQGRPSNISRYQSDGIVTGGLVATGPGIFWGALLANVASPGKCLLLFDATSLPSSGAAPLITGALSATSATVAGTVGDFVGQPFTTGLFWAASISAYSLNQTGINSSSCRVYVQFTQ